MDKIIKAGKDVFKKKEKTTAPCRLEDRQEDTVGEEDGDWLLIDPIDKEHKVGKDDFAMIGSLGKGSFGRVLLVKKKDTGEKLAMKIVQMKDVLDHGRVQDLFSERNVLKKSKHPFIVKLDCTFRNDCKLFFVMQYMEGGDLDLYLNGRPGKKFELAIAKVYAAEVFLALEYLHSHNVIYRDLKPENVLLDIQGHAHLSDFGLSKDFGDEEQDDISDHKANSFVGSPYYVAPDVLRVSKDRPYNNMVDWWSYGVLLFRMLTGEIPFKGGNIRAVFDSILKVPLDLSPYSLDEDAKDLITGLLQKNPQNRFGSTRIKEHRFFKDIDFDKVYSKKYDLSFACTATTVPEEYPNEDPASSAPNAYIDAQLSAFDGFTYTAKEPELSSL